MREVNVCTRANSGILTRRRDFHCCRQEIGDRSPLLGRFHFGESARHLATLLKHLLSSIESAKTDQTLSPPVGILGRKTSQGGVGIGEPTPLFVYPERLE
jgi:hypothetical protein